MGDADGTAVGRDVPDGAEDVGWAEVGGAVDGVGLGLPEAGRGDVLDGDGLTVLEECVGRGRGRARDVTGKRVWLGAGAVVPPGDAGPAGTVVLAGRTTR